jgi:hypothetical protein
MADAQFERAFDQGRVVGVHHPHGDHGDADSGPAQDAGDRLGIIHGLGVEFQAGFADQSGRGRPAHGFKNEFPAAITFLLFFHSASFPRIKSMRFILPFFEIQNQLDKNKKGRERERQRENKGKKKKQEVENRCFFLLLSLP